MGHGRIHRRIVITHVWESGDRVVLRGPMPARVSRSYHDSVVVERGPLVFALLVGKDWKKITAGMKKPAIEPATDWEVHPTAPWNYGLIVAEGATPKAWMVVEAPIRDFPFSSDGAPVKITVQGRRLPDWNLMGGSARPLPISPVSSQDPIETTRLVP